MGGPVHSTAERSCHENPGVPSQIMPPTSHCRTVDPVAATVGRQSCVGCLTCLIYDVKSDFYDITTPRLRAPSA